MAGSQTFSNGTWSFQAGGPDIWDVYDFFHFVYQPLTADGTVSARVVSVGPAKTGSDIQWEKAGVMLRQTTNPQSPYYGVFITPQHGVVVQWRSTQAGQTSSVAAAAPSPNYPVYLMVGRWKDPHPGGATYYTAYTSTDNVKFTAVPGSTIAMNLPGTLLAGIAADSKDQKVTLPVTFDNVALFNTEPAPPGACPSSVGGCADVGNPAPAGSQSLSNGVWTIQGGGGDIWDTVDHFHYVYNSISTDSTVSVQLNSQQATSPWAKAGLMMRGSVDAGSPYYALLITPSNGLAVQWRTVQGGTTSKTAAAAMVPVFLRVSRRTTTGATPTTSYSAWTSPDGSTWSLVQGSTVTIALSATYLEGLAVTSHNTSMLSQAAFVGLSFTP
jgi:hypothetical protein